MCVPRPLEVDKERIDMEGESDEEAVEATIDIELEVEVQIGVGVYRSEGKRIRSSSDIACDTCRSSNS